MVPIKPKAQPQVEDGADIATIAVSAVSSVLEKPENSKGCTKLRLRTGSFKHVKDAYDGTKANEVVNTYFSTDDDLNSILEPMGFLVDGDNIVKP